MKPRYKMGLLIGGIGLVLNIFVSTALGICGPLMALIAGAVSGFLTTRQEKLASKGEGAKAGAISGLVAGALVLVGQILGAVGALVLTQRIGLPTFMGSAPAPGAAPAQQAFYYLVGMGTGACFGMIGLVLSALAAAGMGYVGTSEHPPVVINQ